MAPLWLLFCIFLLPCMSYKKAFYVVLFGFHKKLINSKLAKHIYHDAILGYYIAWLTVRTTWTPVSITSLLAYRVFSTFVLMPLFPTYLYLDRCDPFTVDFIKKSFRLPPFSETIFCPDRRYDFLKFRPHYYPLSRILVTIFRHWFEGYNRNCCNQNWWYICQ